jgi:hypothetical protein
MNQAAASPIEEQLSPLPFEATIERLTPAIERAGTEFRFVIPAKTGIHAASGEV